MDFEIPAELRQKLNQVSAPEPATPYMFFSGSIHEMTTGGVNTEREPRWFRQP